MTVSKKDLFLSVLAMDAYNQGNKPSIGHGQSSVGTTQVVLQSNVTPGSPEITAGFSATAYSSGDEIIISYRGTDDPSTDVLTGWTTILGYPGQSDLKLWS